MSNVSFSAGFDFKQLITTVLTILVSFFMGFWTAKRIYENKTSVKNFVSTTNSSSSAEVVAKEVDGVFWIKAGEEAICPETHVVKAKFSEGVGFFYTLDNKMYGRVKPELCLANEEYARKSGFLKK